MTRDAEIKVTVNNRELQKGARDAKTKVKRELGALGREVGRSIKGAFTGALDIAGVGSIGALAMAARKVYGFQDSLVRLQISAGKSKDQIKDLEKAFFDIGKSTAVDPDEILKGAQAFTALTGDLNTYAAGMEDLAKVSTATGTSMDDLAKVAAGLRTNLGIQGGEFGKAFDILAAQGKAGAVELNELATQLAGLTPRFATFGKTGTEGLAELGSLLQNVRGGFGTTGEAATALESLMGSLVAHAGKFKKEGINVFDVGPDGEKHLRPLSDLIFEIGDSKLFKDPTKLITILGRKEGYQALLQVVNQGRGSFDRLADSQRSAGTIAKDFNTYMDSTAGKTKAAQAALAEVFNEQLKDHLNGIAGALRMIAKLVGWIGEHPISAALLFGASRFGPGLIGAGLAARGAGGAVGAAAGAGGSAAAGAAGGAGGGLLMLAAKAGALAAAGAAGIAIGRYIDEKTGLSMKLANLAKGNGWTGARVEGEGDREERLRQEAIKRDSDAQLQGRIKELTGLGYRGSIAPDAVNALYEGQGATRLKQSAAAARALGVTDEEIRRRGSDELQRQFPVAIGAEGMELDVAKRNKVLASTPDAMEFARTFGAGLRGGTVSGPVGPQPVDVRVVISFEGDKPIAQVVRDSKTHRNR